MVRIYFTDGGIVCITRDAEHGRIISTAIDALGFSGFLNKLGRNESGYYFYSELADIAVRVVFE